MGAGSCLGFMGFHWEKFLEPQELPYKAGDLMPVVPMYHSVDGTLNGILFAATNRKQTWPEECPNPHGPCAVGKVNMWDYSPGLQEPNIPPFYMCSNFCGECSFEGTADGWFTTMHFFLRDTFPRPGNPDRETCNGSPRLCREGL